jgi:hypothetical protein
MWSAKDGGVEQKRPRSNYVVYMGQQDKEGIRIGYGQKDMPVDRMKIFSI